MKIKESHPKRHRQERSHPEYLHNIEPDTFRAGEGINITTDFCICEEQRLEGLTLPPLQLLLSAWVHEFFLFWVVGIVYFQMERRFSRLVPFTHRQGKGEFAFFLLNTSFNFCSFIQGTAKKIRISFK